MYKLKKYTKQHLLQYNLFIAVFDNLLKPKVGSSANERTKKNWLDYVRHISLILLTAEKLATNFNTANC